ncbi:transposase [soil metagenome]
MTRRYQKFKPEFREQAARLVIDGDKPVAQVARDIGVGETTLGHWVRKYRETHADAEPALQLSERARLRELERRNRELEMENAFLKKAAAYFAKEPR